MPNEEEELYGEAFDDEGDEGIETNDGPLELVFDVGSNTYILRADPDWTITKTQQEMKNKAFGTQSSREWKYVIKYNGNRITDGTLRSNGLIQGRKTLSTISSTSGGSSNNFRKIPKHKQIKIVKGKCCIYKEEVECAKMRCGHTISGLAMYKLLKLTLNRNEYALMKCPVPKCRTLWNYKLCCKIASVNQNEKIEYYMAFKKRGEFKTGKLRPCPFCKSSCEKPKSLKEAKVQCCACKSDWWCFRCGGKWIGKGNVVCGNKNCRSMRVQREIDLSKQLPEKDRGSWAKRSNKLIIVYDIRACPNCISLIEHTKNCPHMICQQCGYEFCFICLSPYKNHSGHNSGTCLPHPKQKLY